MKIKKIHIKVPKGRNIDDYEVKITANMLGINESSKVIETGFLETYNGMYMNYEELKITIDRLLSSVWSYILEYDIRLT